MRSSGWQLAWASKSFAFALSYSIGNPSNTWKRDEESSKIISGNVSVRAWKHFGLRGFINVDLGLKFLGLIYQYFFLAEKITGLIHHRGIGMLPYTSNNLFCGNAI